MTLRKKRKQKQITEMVRTLILVKIGFDDSEKEEKTKTINTAGLTCSKVRFNDSWKEEKTEICHLLG